VNLSVCPPAGAGVHSWILASANRCRNSGVSATDAEALIVASMTRCPAPANEVTTTIRKAYSAPDFRSSCFTSSAAPVPITKIRYDPNKLRAYARNITPPNNWRHWLWERSPKIPESQNAYSFLKHLYFPGEKVAIYDNEGDPCTILTIADPMDCRVPAHLKEGGRGSGIWFLANPIDGAMHWNPRQHKFSAHSAEAITSFRYMVLESDHNEPGEQENFLAMVAQLPLRVAAITTSGRRSHHVLVRVDARSREHFEEIAAPLKRPLAKLGCDPAVLSARRLSRLPGCARPEKSGFQKLLFLNPNPAEVRLTDVPVSRTRASRRAQWAKGQM
jgi:DNA-binding Lrp family transcriptional regulator